MDDPLRESNRWVFLTVADHGFCILRTRITELLLDSRPPHTAREARNWTLDERGLDGLLIFDGRRLRLDGTSQVLLGGPWQPLTVVQRLTLQHQLDRTEFLTRIGLRVSP
jgi:hypothetical protein